VPTPLVHAALAALIACGSAPRASIVPVPERAPTASRRVSEALDACEGYRTAGPEPYGRCLTGHAGRLVAVEELEDLCGRAGIAEGACRDAWVGPRRQAGSLPLETQLRACGTNSDCALQSLERLPSPDIHLQLQRCRTFVPDHVDYCLGHALRRWVRTNPDAQQASSVLLRADAGMLAGRMLGRWSACQGMDLCPPGATQGEVMCRASAEAIRTKRETCEDEGRRE
jgi:hypothetical protein